MECENTQEQQMVVEEEQQDHNPTELEQQKIDLIQQHQNQELVEDQPDKKIKTEVEGQNIDLVSAQNQQKKEDQLQQNQNEDTQQVKITKKPEKPVSAYIYFIKHYKQQFSDKLSLADLGKIWREMSMDEKQKYYKMHEDDKARYQKDLDAYLAQVDEQQDNNDNQGENEHPLEEEIEFAFPISRIKGILKADEDLKGITQENLVYFEKATELFGNMLIQKCERNMMENKRKTMQSVDLQSVIKRDPYLKWLECLFENPEEEEQEQEDEGEDAEDDKIHEEEEGDGEEGKKENNKQKQKNQLNNNKKKKEESSNQRVIPKPKNNTTLDQFFKKK